MAVRRAIPAQGTWTYEDLQALPDDGKRYEIVEGMLYEMTGPTAQHVTALVNLIRLLLPVVEAMGARWYPAPFDLFVPGGDPVQPDLQVILRQGRAKVVGRGIVGPPDLVVEILSPSTRGHDLLTKRALYARAGVHEYWIVDPVARTVAILVLDGDALRERQIAAGSQPVSSRVLPTASFPAESVFAGFDDLDPEP